MVILRAANTAPRRIRGADTKPFRMTRSSKRGRISDSSFNADSRLKSTGKAGIPSQTRSLAPLAHVGPPWEAAFPTSQLQLPTPYTATCTHRMSSLHLPTRQPLFRVQWSETSIPTLVRLLRLLARHICKASLELVPSRTQSQHRVSSSPSRKRPPSLPLFPLPRFLCPLLQAHS